MGLPDLLAIYYGGGYIHDPICDIFTVSTGCPVRSSSRRGSGQRILSPLDISSLFDRDARRAHATIDKIVPRCIDRPRKFYQRSDCRIVPGPLESLVKKNQLKYSWMKLVFFFSSLDEIDRRIGSVARISERNPVGRAKWVNKAILKPRGVYRGIPNVHSGADTLELRNYMDGHRHPTIRHTVSLSSAYLGRLHIFPSFLSLSLSLFTIFQREC